MADEPINGRAMTFKWDAAVLVGVKSRTLSISNEWIDVTTDDDEGWRTLLGVPGLRSIEVTLAMVTTNELFLYELLVAGGGQNSFITTLPTTLGTAGTITGTFAISNVEYSGDSDGVIEISATFMSSGEMTYVASSA